MPLFLFSKLKIRIAIQVIFWIFIVLTGILAFDLVDIKAHDDEWFLAWMMGLSVLILFVPWLLFKIPALKKHSSESLLGWLELLLAGAMSLSWIGAFGPYRWGIGYDSFVHYAASLLAALGFATLFYTIKPAFRTKPFTIFILVMLLTIFAGVLNEGFEYYGDLIWGTEMYGEAGQANDTMIDYVFDFIGATLGAVLSIKYRKDIFKLMVS